MKRVAIYYENRYRNDGFPLYAWNLLRDKELYPDIDLTHLIPHGDYEKFGKFDLNLWIDFGEDSPGYPPYEVVWPTGAPVAYFASDTHLGFEYRKEMCKKADYAFVAQKEGWEKIKKEVPDAIWLPHGVEPRAFPAEPKAMKKYDVCFVGHIVSSGRLDFLDRMFKEFPNFWFGSRLSRYVQVEQGINDDCGDIFKKSKIVLNPPTKGDTNMRIFETLSTGSFLLTEEVYGLNELYKNGVHLVTYKTMDEAIEKAKYYLEHDEEREKIAQAGMEHTIKNHTYMHRVKDILKTAGIIKKGE